MQTPRLSRSLSVATDSALGWSAALVEVVAFWAAVVLPFAYLPLLAIGAAGPRTLGPLFVANLVAYAVGRDHATGDGGA